MSSKSKEKFEICGSRSSSHNTSLLSSGSTKSVLSKKLAEKESWRTFDGGSSRYSLDSKRSETKRDAFPAPRVEKRVHAIVVPKDRSRNTSNIELNNISEQSFDSQPLVPVRSSRRKVVFRPKPQETQIVKESEVEDDEDNPRQRRNFPCEERKPYWKWILLALTTALVIGLAYKRFAK